MTDSFEKALIETFLDEAEDQLIEWERLALDLEQSLQVDLIHVLFRFAHNMKGSSRSCGLLNFGDFIHKIEDLIVLVRDNKIPLSPSIATVLLECHERLSNWVEELRQDTSYVIETADIVKRISDLSPGGGQSAQQASTASQTSQTSFGFFDDDETTKFKNSEQNNDTIKNEEKKLGEILVERGLVSQDVLDQALSEQKQRTQTDETIRISSKKLDLILRTISEISIHNEILSRCWENDNIVSELGGETIHLIYKSIKELQDQAFGLRMQPVQTLMQRLKRTALDVAKKQDKHLDIVTIGEDIELDKSMIEQIKDPLVHIIRNAVDHGIESAHDRIASQKTEPAQIMIKAEPIPAGVLISIKDNGRGLNRERILKKAIEKGLIPESHNLKDHEIYQLIMEPGFSTAEVVTDISGRGVGMDVVRQAVTKMGGTITIESKAGEGSNFNIELPSNLSVLEALIVRVANAIYAVPLSDLEEVLQLTEQQLASRIHGEHVFDHKNELVHLWDMKDFLPIYSRFEQNQKKSGFEPQQSNHVALITKANAQKIAYLVDEVIGQQSIVVRPLDGDLAKQDGFSGGTILSNGEPGMILNIKAFVANG